MYGGAEERDRIKRDKTNKKQEGQDNRDRDKIQKGTKSRGGGRRVLGTLSRGKGLLLQMGAFSSRSVAMAASGTNT